jgi:hypothetical protein
VIFRGYIDESYGEGQNIFALSCIIARGSDWLEIERRWKLHLSAKNKELKKSGRPLISRYHASDCSGRKREFKGWTHDERDAFVRGLFQVFKVPTMTIVFDAQLNDLCEVFPEWAADRLDAGYGVLTTFLLYVIGRDFRDFSKGFGKTPRIRLFHDRTGGDGKHDPTILRSFTAQMNKPDFPHRDYFSTIEPLGWQECIALQPADLLAFECFKEAEARLAGRDSRRSFKALLNTYPFGIHSKTFQKSALIEYRKKIEEASGSGLSI